MQRVAVICDIIRRDLDNLGTEFSHFPRWNFSSETWKNFNNLDFRIDFSLLKAAHSLILDESFFRCAIYVSLSNTEQVLILTRVIS